MSRDLPTDFITELTSDVVYPFFAVELDFASGPLYFWTGYGDLLIDGITYIGVGNLVSISSVEETTEIEARGATITMTGIPSSFLSLALQEPYQGRECNIYFGLSLSNESSTRYLIEIFSGELDQMNISESADSATIAVTVENALIRLERPTIRRFTSEDQKSRFPSDTGLRFVAGLQDKEIFWGRKASTKTN